MMTSSNGNIFALLAICAGIHRSPVNSPHKGQWRGALMFSLICAWINGRVNNGKAGDLRRIRAHYDVIVMRYFGTIGTWKQNLDKYFSHSMTSPAETWLKSLHVDVYYGITICRHQYQFTRQMQSLQLPVKYSFPWGPWITVVDFYPMKQDKIR